MLHTKLSRRRFAKTALAGAGASVLPAPFVRSALAAQSVTIAQISPFAGAFAFAGPLLERGMKMALEEVNGKVAGQAINFIKRDTETKAGVAVRRLTEAIENENVKYFAGNYSSSVGLALSEVAKKQKVVQYAGGGSEEFTGARCNRYMFQWSSHAYTALKAVLDYVATAHPDVKRLYAFTWNYVFGESMFNYARINAAEKGMEIVGNDLHPIGERQFNQYLTKAIAAKPDAILLLNYGQDALTAIRQFHNFGVADKIKIIGPWTMEIDHMRELSSEMRKGIILGQNYYFTIDTPVNNNFVGAYTERFGEPPTYAAGYGYDTIRTLLLGMKEAGSTNPADVIPALEKMTYKGLLGDCSIDASTHQTVRPYYVVVGKGADEMRNATDFARVVHSASDPQPKNLNKCTDIGSI